MRFSNITPITIIQFDGMTKTGLDLSKFKSRILVKSGIANIISPFFFVLFLNELLY